MNASPRLYRRRGPLIEAVQLDADNADQVAALVGGAVTRPLYGDTPIIRLPSSIHPVRVGDFAVRDQPLLPWHTMARVIFEGAYEPCCEQCGR